MIAETKPLVSVIIPVYNSEKYINKCISSVLKQDYENIELICVNDGSTDNSLKIMKDISLANPFILIDIENRGVSNARNIGIQKANGKYLMFLDSDDWLDLNAISTMVSTMMKYCADTVMCTYVKEYKKSIPVHIFDDIILVMKEKDILEKIHRRLFGPIGNEVNNPGKLDALVSPCMQLFTSKIVKKSSFIDIKKIGSFEDGLFQMDYYKECKKFVYIDKPFYHYRKENYNSITSKYNPNLINQRNFLYDLIEDKIKTEKLSCFYTNGLQNRIALGFISIGLNEIQERKGTKRIREYLKSDRYADALKQLNTSNMPLIWKIFFGCAKKKFFLSVFLMLKSIKILKRKSS